MRFERGRGGYGGGRGGGFRGGGGFRDRSFGSSEPKPVKIGEEYDVEISEVGSRGDGIARVNNFVVFVNGTKQGEKTKIKIKEVRNRFAIGEKVGAGEAASEASEETASEAPAETTETASEEAPVEETTEEATEEETE